MNYYVTHITVCYSTPGRVCFRWSALPLRRASLLQCGDIHDNHGTFQPSAGVVGRNRYILSSRVQPIYNFVLPLSHSAQERPVCFSLVEPYVWYGLPELPRLIFGPRMPPSFRGVSSVYFGAITAGRTRTGDTPLERSTSMGRSTHSELQRHMCGGEEGKTRRIMGGEIRGWATPYMYFTFFLFPSIYILCSKNFFKLFQR